MSGLQVPCPKCDSLLKLPGREYLGRKGKCPHCGHRFLLTDPDEAVPLELVSPPEIRTGTSARWVPDSPAASQPGPAATGMPAAAAEATAAAGSPFDFSPPADSSAGAPLVTAPSDVPVSQRFRRRKPRKGLFLMGGGVAIVVGIIIGVVLVSQNQTQTTTDTGNATQRNEAWEQEKQDQADSNEAAVELSPTKGSRIPLDYIPFTPHVVAHLRPAELWQSKPKYQKFMATLAQLGVWLNEQIPALTHFDPQEIEELTLAVNFGSRSSEPEVAAVVRLTKEYTQSDLNARFRGGMRPEFDDVAIFECVEENRCFLQIDRQTFAVASSLVAEELAGAAKFPEPPDPEMEPLLRESDRTRLCTLVFDMKTVDTHRQFVFIEPMQKLVDEFIIWMGDDIEVVSWSIHLEPNLFMETLLRQSNDASAMKVERAFQLQMQRLPERLVHMTGYMKPETVGRYQLISRFPAMMKAVDAGTSYHMGPGFVRLVTILPPHAATALAAASVYSWDQSVVTDFNVDRPSTTSVASIPDRIEDRLKLPVFVDFRNTPLNESLEYISDVIKTPIELDGDGLKQAAFTQVMPQTYNLGNVPALVAIDTILKKYAAERDPMVMVLAADSDRILITVKSKATDQGLPVYDTSGRK
ncbi:MAG: hypothetical protein KDA96_18875 [Planctomycetaceae bacterium]|nr:hypothetical protein [Planctomycetaceae bacterium]